MIPSYPSVTFPNHYTIVTGLYPEHHGIVANTFYDPARKETYSLTDPKTTGDGSWYAGTPLWVLAEQQGMRAACFFWPSSDAEIQGKRPSYIWHLTMTNFPMRNASIRCSRGCSFRRKKGPISSRFTSRYGSRRPHLRSRRAGNSRGCPARRRNDWKTIGRDCGIGTAGRPDCCCRSRNGNFAGRLGDSRQMG